MDSDDLRRYARHILITEIGKEGQQKLLDSSVLMIGAGGLGAASISYLAAAGIGHIGIVDHDHVELSNLNRQIIHEFGDIGRKKVESAADRVSEINPDCVVVPYDQKLTNQNAQSILEAKYSIVIDGSDNFPTRFAVNDACYAARIPLVSGAVRGLEGQISTFKPYLGAGYPCYRCLVLELPPNRNDCAEGGILGPIVGVIGSLMAVEAIKEILSLGESLSGRLLRYDARAISWKESRLTKDPGCPVCSRA